MECEGNGPEPCASPPASWWAGSCRVCEPDDDRARFGLPRGKLLTADRLCRECGRTWPAENICHRCGGTARQAVDYWKRLGSKRPPTVSAEAQMIGVCIDRWAVANDAGMVDRESADRLAAEVNARGVLAEWWRELANDRARAASNGAWLGRDPEAKKKKKEAGHGG